MKEEMTYEKMQRVIAGRWMLVGMLILAAIVGYRYHQGVVTERLIQIGIGTMALPLWLDILLVPFWAMAFVMVQSGWFYDAARIMSKYHWIGIPVALVGFLGSIVLLVCGHLGALPLLALTLLLLVFPNGLVSLCKGARNVAVGITKWLKGDDLD